MPKVTVIIPLYNKEKTIARALDSIWAQRYQDFDVIVVDDGSTDGSVDIVRGYDDPRLRLIQQKNAGPGAARNTGIAHTTTEFVSFLDADDEWYPWFLENCYKAITENDVALVVTMFELLPEKEDATERLIKNDLKLGCYDLNGKEESVLVVVLLSLMKAWNSLLYTEVARKYDGFYDKDNCRFGEDATFFMRLIFNEKFMMIGPVSVRYHTENSELDSETEVSPLPAFLKKTEIVLRYCPDEKRELLCRVLAVLAFYNAKGWIHFGKRFSAFILLLRFFDGHKYCNGYWKYLSFSLPGYPYWRQCKNRVIKPVIKCLRKK
ncbi:MAG: glycosyltransferase family 2 protein [Phycisphaerae bacterium]|nr:glycosyltransferase family 2 protein [Phycisphaerae bacterium]